MLGAEHADTLMMSLQMAQSDQIATKTDVDRLEARFDVLEDRFSRLEDRFDAFAVEIRGEVREMHVLTHQQFRNYTITMVSAMTALTAIFAVVVGIIG